MSNIETIICYLSISGRVNFSQMARFGQSCESRFRDDVRLRYLYNGPRVKRRGRPKKFDGDVDINNPREDVFKKTTVKDGDSIVTLYFAKVYAVSLTRAVGAVIVVYDDPDKKTQARKVYFSTDLTLSGEDVKLLIHNTVMVQRILSTFGKTPNLNLNQKNIKELLFYGVKTAA